ncbi:FAD-binding protein [Rhizobium sp. CFBP 8752]|uniref:FAD-binding protein n=1 Tax=Rhizobium sp. CFBP 8752 TaxID=2775301 RepID=UPI001782A4EB|nr:FAD-binding protein [Rhizobium sp. CFBP 8752]MBD8664224.1 FAD-binding protein [Rhizobium sp. CFBP 8752]
MADPLQQPNDRPAIVDLICIGGGLGGMAAAIRAHDRGLSVMILESSAYVGGGAAYSGGLCWLPGMIGQDSAEAGNDYLTHVEGEKTGSDPQKRLAMIGSMVEAAQYFRQAGINLDVVAGNPDVFYPAAKGSVGSGRMFESAVSASALGEWRERLMPSPHYRIGLRHRELYDDALGLDEKEQLFARRRVEDLLTMGTGLSGSFVAAALIERGIPCLTGHRVNRLIVRAGKVAGVEATTVDGMSRTFLARRGVIFATGGYSWAKDVADIEGLPDFVDAGPPSNAGDHLSMATLLGAAVVRGCGPQFSMGGVIDRREVHPGSEQVVCRQLFDVMGLPHTLVINRDGKRFGDESYYVGINEALREWDPIGKRWVNFPCFLIFDEQYRQTYPLAGLSPSGDYPDTVVQAESLEALAQKLGIDGAALVETAYRFSEAAERGEDPDFGRGTLAFVRRRYGDLRHQPNANLGSVQKPPFYGLQLRLLGTGMCTFGLKTDACGRVQRMDDTAIAGLFAIGNAAASSEFRAYVTGYANSRNIGMAYAAANAV